MAGDSNPAHNGAVPMPPQRDLPSLQIRKQMVTCSLPDFLKLIDRALAPVNVDETWYLARYPDVSDAIRKGSFRSARHHYCASGYLEGRLPAEPDIDEAWYVRKYPDVAEAIKGGAFKSAKDHYVVSGYKEGRQARG